MAFHMFMVHSDLSLNAKALQSIIYMDSSKTQILHYLISQDIWLYTVRELATLSGEATISVVFYFLQIEGLF